MFSKFVKQMISRVSEDPRQAEKEEQARIAENKKYFNAQNKKGKTALHKAVSHNLFAGVLDLISDKGDIIDVNQADQHGNTPLHLAAEKRDTNNFTAVLLHAGASINAANDIGETPLHRAVINNSVVNVQHLWIEKADINAATYKNVSGSRMGMQTPLHYAFQLKTISNDIVKTLLMAGADCRIRNDQAKTVLHLAVSHPNISELDEELFDKLLEQFAHITESDSESTILHEAAKNKKLPEKYFKKILEVVALRGSAYEKQYLNQKDKAGNTALFYVAGNSDDEKTLLLLPRDIDPNNWTHSSPLHEACKNSNTSVAIALIERGAKMNVEDNHHLLPLNYAAKNGGVEIVQHMANKQFNFANKHAEIALKESILNNHASVALALIKNGTNANVKIYPRRSVTSSSMKFSSTSSNIKSGDGKDKTGCLQAGDTPLHYAVRIADKELATACLACNKNMVNQANDRANTPATIAIKKVDLEMAQLIGALGDDIEFSQHYAANQDSPQKTLLMQGYTRGFPSHENIKEFFYNPNYQLSDEQLQKKEQAEKKYSEQRGRYLLVKQSVFPMAKKEASSLVSLIDLDNNKQEDNTLQPRKP